MSAPKFPKSILYYVPFTITNNASAATPAPFQQMVVVNPSLYTSYLASDLSNVQWYDSSGNVINSWLESGNSNTGTEAVYWLSLANGIGANSTITVYMGIASITTNLLNNTTTGEAPQLSATYGNYDDGASVFNNYWNFAGTSLPNGWSLYTGSGSGGSITVNNGITLNSNGQGPFINSITTMSAPSVIDGLVLANAYAEIGFGVVNGYAFAIGDFGAGPLNEYGIGTTNSYGSVTGWISLGGSETMGTKYILSGYYTNSAQLFSNYQLILTGSISPSTQNLEIGGYSTQPATSFIQWLRVRAYPPNGIMPAISAGSIVVILIPGVTVTAIPSLPQYKTVSGVTDSNGKVSLQFALNVPYTLKFSGAAVGTVNNFSPGNDTITFYNLTNSSSSSISVGGQAVAPGTSVYLIPGQIPISTSFANFKSWSPGIYFANQSSKSTTLNMPNVDISINITALAYYAYVAFYNSYSVSVIDTGTNAVVATISVGSEQYAVAITPDGNYAYVTTYASNSVSVIDTSTNTVVATISVGSGPAGIAITPDGNYAYVANYSSNTVSVIDTGTNTVIATIPVGSEPLGVAITPDGNYAYVANYSSVSVIDTSTNTVIATISVGSDPEFIAITPDGSYAYVTNNGSNTVSVIDTGTNAVVATIPVGSEPVGVAITPDGSYAYVTNYGSNTVSVIDTSTNVVVATITVGNGPEGVAITPDGNYAYVVNDGSNTVSVIDTGTNAVVATISVGSEPIAVAIKP